MGEVIKLKVATSEEVISLKSASGSLAVEAVSPRVSLEKVDGGTRLDITDVEGTKSTIIPNGERGDPGESYTFDEYPTDNSPNPVRSRGLKSEFDSVRSDIQHYYDSAVEAVLNSEIRLNMKFGQKQDVLTFDEYPTVNSDNPVKSNGIKILIDAIIRMIPRRVSDLIDDSGHYIKPGSGIPASDLASGVIPDISGKQDLLLFDAAPTLQSMNPVTSNGIKRAIDIVYNQLSGETDIKLLAKANRVDECTEGNFAALDENGNLVDSGNKASDFVTDVQVNGTSVLSNGVANVPAALDGATFTPSVSNEGVISWTNDGGKTNPQSVNIKGPQGEPGTAGQDGSDGADGVTFTPSVSNEGVISWTNDGGRTNPQSVNIRGPQGETGPTGPQGPQGDDYVLTDADKTEIAGKVFTPVPLPVSILVTGYFIKYDSGNEYRHSNSTYSASSFVCVSGCKRIRYKRTKTNGASSYAGMSFYYSDKTYIPHSGIVTVVGQDSVGYYGMYEVDVPEGATYARFTMLTDAQTYGEFEVYGFKDVLGFDALPTADSSNLVTSGGVYTALQAKADPVTVETVSGTDPVITGVDNHRYVCGMVDTLTLTPPASGIVDVVFTSGTTPTVLSVTPPSGMTMRWPDWFNPSALEASATYEINILDGTLGMVGIWT